MATFCDKVTYNFSIKADVNALFAGEDGFSDGLDHSLNILSSSCIT